MLWDGDSFWAPFWMQRMSDNSVRFFVDPIHPVLGVNMTIQEEVGFIQKPDIIQELMSSFLRKPQAHG